MLQTIMATCGQKTNIRRMSKCTYTALTRFKSNLWNRPHPHQKGKKGPETKTNAALSWRVILDLVEAITDGCERNGQHERFVQW